MGIKGNRQTAAGGEMAESCVERLGSLDQVSSRKMFGGHGIFQKGKMFALVTSGAELYFKADDANRASFTKARAPQHGKMPYFRVPKNVLADDRKLLAWARESVRAAHA